MAAVDGALDIYDGVSMGDVRAKSLNISAYLMYLIDTRLAGYGFSIGNPRDDERRGGHVALEHPDAVQINEALKAANVIPDFRYPDVIRLAPVPLCTRYQDVYELVERLKNIMDTESYKQYAKKAGTVA